MKVKHAAFVLIFRGGFCVQILCFVGFGRSLRVQQEDGKELHSITYKKPAL